MLQKAAYGERRCVDSQQKEQTAWIWVTALHQKANQTYRDHPVGQVSMFWHLHGSQHRQVDVSPDENDMTEEDSCQLQNQFILRTHKSSHQNKCKCYYHGDKSNTIFEQYWISSGRTNRTDAAGSAGGQSQTVGKSIRTMGILTRLPSSCTGESSYLIIFCVTNIGAMSCGQILLTGNSWLMMGDTLLNNGEKNLLRKFITLTVLFFCIWTAPRHTKYYRLNVNPCKCHI